MMKGGMQITWASKKVWFASGGTLDWLAVSTLSLLVPKVTSYAGTISFCPAHLVLLNGQDQETYANDALSPLQDLMSQNGLISRHGSWAFRNVGGIRDSVVPVDVDKMSPSCFHQGFTCPYCADISCWNAAYIAGSMCDNGREADFRLPDSIARQIKYPICSSVPICCIWRFFPMLLSSLPVQSTSRIDGLGYVIMQ